MSGRRLPGGPLMLALAAFGLLALASCTRSEPEAPPPSPPALPGDLSAPPQEALESESVADRLIDCAGAALALAETQAATKDYGALMLALLDKEGIEAAALDARVAAAKTRWTQEPTTAQTARILVCQGEWPPG